MVDYKPTSDKNQVLLNCPECPEDTKYHMTYYFRSTSAYCHKCQTWMSKWQLEDILGPMPTSEFDDQKTNTLEEALHILEGKAPQEEIPQEIELPAGVSAWSRKRSRSYLQKRGVPQDLVLKHQIRFVTEEGMFENRILVPVIWRGKIVTFSARTINGGGKKYLFPRGSHPGNYLFNLNNVKGKTVMLTEGVFDALHLQRFGLPTVASFGKALTRTQMNLLKSFSRAVFFWDSDAYSEIAKYMGKLGIRVSAALLPEGDPCEYNESQILRFIQKDQGQLGVARKILERS